MSDWVGRSLLRTATLGVYDVRCLAPAGGPGPDEQADETQVVLPLSGVFEVHHGPETLTADAASVVVLGAERVHRVAHPATSGDRSMVMVYPPEVAEEAMGEDGPRGGTVGSRVHLGARALGSGLARDAIEVPLGLRHVSGVGPSGPDRWTARRTRTLVRAEDPAVS